MTNKGVVEALLKEQSEQSALKPILIVSDIKKDTSHKQTRYKLRLSDGEAVISALLDQPLNHYVEADLLHSNDVIQLLDFSIIRKNDFTYLFVKKMKGNYKEEKKKRPVSNGDGAAAAAPTGKSGSKKKKQKIDEGDEIEQFPSQPVSSAVQVSKVEGDLIEKATPFHKTWVIQARITSKSDIRSWDKGPDNSGRLFSIDLIDKAGNEIKATFFHEAVDLFYGALNVGAVYNFSNGTLKVANPQFNTCKNEYEINFSKNAAITPCEDKGQIGRVHLDVVTIAAAAEKPAKTLVDVIAIASDVGDVTAFTSKAGNELRKMEFTLTDQSNCSISVTAWGEKADELSSLLSSVPDPKIVAIKNASVGEFNGKNLSVNRSSVVLMNPPEFKETDDLKAWHSAGPIVNVKSASDKQASGEDMDNLPLEERCTIADIIYTSLDEHQKHVVKGSISFIKGESMFYASCSNRSCAKKLIEYRKSVFEPVQWVCEKCKKTYDVPQFSYKLNFHLSDATGMLQTMAFRDIATLVMGISATELQSIQKKDETKFRQILNDVLFKDALFRVIVKEEVYLDNTVRKATLLAYRLVDYEKENKLLADAVSQVQNQEDSGEEEEHDETTRPPHQEINDNEEDDDDENENTANQKVEEEDEDEEAEDKEEDEEAEAEEEEEEEEEEELQ